jgi:5-carboxymethyl-2-hydroxymuconic-semialdehyde dehydrogenase
VLHAVADGIERRAEDLAQVETSDNGALLRSHRRGVMPRAAQNFRFFADWLGGLDAAKLAMPGYREQVSRSPSGVTAVITPWNAPLMLATWRIAPALAAGNTVVAKPPEWAPLTASLLAGITREAGLPDGVFNVVQGLGADAGAPLAAHPDVARVAFTGSVAAGRQVAAAAGAQLTPVSLELGGKSPLLVFADADLDLAVEIAVGQYDNAGQVCLAGTRLLVEERVAGGFTERFLARAAALRQGDPRDEATDVGPNITRAHLQRVDGFVQRAVAAGARPLLGGGPNDELGGLYYRPTLLAGPAPGAEILTEEVFGPVLTLQTFAAEDEAVALANDTRYGLAATVLTGDEQRAERVSARLTAGTVWVNCFFIRDLRAPFGGTGLSGIGREGGTWSFDFYSDIKNTVYAAEGWRHDG